MLNSDPKLQDNLTHRKLTLHIEQLTQNDSKCYPTEPLVTPVSHSAIYTVVQTKLYYVLFHKVVDRAVCHASHTM